MGVSASKPETSATAASRRRYQVCPPRDLASGSIAPVAIVRVRSGTTSAGSTRISTPSPVQRWQAPCGLLKLNVRGSISPREKPS